MTTRLAGLLMLAIVCAAQDAPEIESREAKPNFSTGVNLVVIPVIVRDRDGKAIGNLTRDDFQLFEKGKPQFISRFSIEKTGEKAAADAKKLEELSKSAGAGEDVAPSHFIAYVFDDLRMDAGEIAAMRGTAWKHIDGTMKSADRVAIYTTSGIGMLDFTDDHDQIEGALRKLQPRPRLHGGTECPDVSFLMADEIINHDNQPVLALATTDAIKCQNLIDATLPGVPGSSGSSGQVQGQAAARSAAARVLAMGESEVQQTFTVLKDIVTRMATSPGQRSVVVISPGIFLTEIYRNYESDLLDRALRSNVTISTLNTHGLYVPDQLDIDRGATARSATARLSYTQQEAQAGDDVLTELAEGTGGTYFHNNNDAAEGLRVTAATPEYIYLLGFSPQNLKYDGKFHSVKVALKAANYNLQARRGYYAPKQAPNEEEQAQEEIKQWMYSREDAQEFPIGLKTQFFKPAPDSARITVFGEVDLKGVQFAKADGRNRDTISIVAGIFDRNGNILKAGGRAIDLKFRDETLAAHLAQGLALKLSFDVAPGKYLVRLVVRSSEGQMMSARNTIVEVP